jgi:hypothetical protein
VHDRERPVHPNRPRAFNRSEAPVPDASWPDDCRFEAICARPGVRTAIAAGARAAGPVRQSAEQFLAPFQGTPIERGVQRAQRNRLIQRLRTGRSRTAEFPQPIGPVIAAALCSLARGRLPLHTVEQRPDGVTLSAVIPSDFRTFGGTLWIALDRTETGTTARAEAEIPGQLYDWGYSKKTLATLFTDLAELPARLIDA